ncbi:restriction endonuclease subunit S [Anoxynatronum sibiricum]|uniref:Restriction endonuclease subunit S n=1 Tax=Anoxynatronum sibiricum TaxID=210623 RepID=A0ABU9VX98_9CLOT
MSKQNKLPTDWKRKRLEEVAIIQTGIAKNQNSKEECIELPYLRVANVQDGYLDLSEIKTINIHKNKVNRYRLEKGDVLLTEGGDFDKLGRGAVWEGQIPNCLHQNHVFAVRPYNHELISSFLSAQTGSSYGKRYFLSCSKQSTNLASINSSQLKAFPVLLPPLPEQKAIADLLTTWDEAIEKTERLIQAKEASLKDRIQRIMGKEAIVANGWPMVRLGDIFSEVSRKVGEKELTPYSISAGIGFVSQRDKWGKDISGSQHKNYTHLKAGEFSYNKGNSKRYQQGCIYLLKEGEICVPNVFISFKPKASIVVSEFFEHYFIADYHARELKRYITSGARSDGLLNLNKKDFFKIMVPCPSSDEQKAIAEALDVSQQEIDFLKQLADKYKTQKLGLMQKVLTGEWRVKPEIVMKFDE